MIDETYNDTIYIEIELDTGHILSAKIPRGEYQYALEELGSNGVELYVIGYIMKRTKKVVTVLIDE